MVRCTSCGSESGEKAEGYHIYELPDGKLVAAEMGSERHKELGLQGYYVDYRGGILHAHSEREALRKFRDVHPRYKDTPIGRAHWETRGTGFGRWKGWVWEGRPVAGVHVGNSGRGSLGPGGTTLEGSRESGSEVMLNFGTGEVFRRTYLPNEFA